MSLCDRVTALRDGQSQGTYETAALSEHAIVDLIVGEAVDHEFPEKSYADSNHPVAMIVSGLSGDGFSGVNLMVRPGEIVGLSGIDGQGKHEFLTGVAGIHPSQGKVLVANKKIELGSTARAADAGLRYLSGSRHRDGMFADLTVRENYSFRTLPKFSRAGLIDQTAETAATTDAIARYDIKAPGPETTIGALSGGNHHCGVAGQRTGGRSHRWSRRKASMSARERSFTGQFAMRH